jgi:RNA polymerase sigma-70 factor (ECF subfamily)
MKPREQLDMLVLRCQIGDTEAFEELFEHYQPRLRYYIRRLDETGTGTDDVLQDIWLAVLRKIRKLRDPKAFPIWLYRIARNRVYGRFRKRQEFAELREEDLASQTNENEPTFSAEEADHIHKALNNIQPHHREVLTLYFIEQMPYQAIAEIVGCNIGTVKSRLYYAKQSLREQLESKNGQ